MKVKSKFLCGGPPDGIASKETGSVRQGIQLALNPNPFSDRLSLSISVPQRSASVCIYDIEGRLVKRFGVALDHGQATLTWDGHDEHGRRLSNGVYFAKLSSAAGLMTQKAIMLR